MNSKTLTKTLHIGDKVDVITQDGMMSAEIMELREDDAKVFIEDYDEYKWVRYNRIKF